MGTPPSVPAVFVGIDVGKEWLDVGVRPGGAAWRVANEEAGVGALVDRLRALGPALALVVLEATGGLERAAAAALAAAGLPVAVVNPRQARAFAQSVGQLAKTDALDAALLARFAEAVRPAVRPLPEAAQQELAALVERRRQLVAMRTAEQNRSHAALPRVRPQIAAHLAWLDAQLGATEREVDAALRASPAWLERVDLLCSAAGVGPVVAATLVAELPELGHIPAKPLAALVGVAPLNRDSGRRRGARAVWGGRAAVRQALSMATLVAIRHTPTIRAFSAGLRARGKPPKVALTACMHKLLTILNALVRDHVPWSAAPPAAPAVARA